jgi:hypothetical protein
MSHVDVTITIPSARQLHLHRETAELIPMPSRIVDESVGKAEGYPRSRMVSR